MKGKHPAPSYEATLRQFRVLLARQRVLGTLIEKQMQQLKRLRESVA